MASPSQRPSKRQDLTLNSPRDTQAIGANQTDAHLGTLRVGATFFTLGFDPSGKRHAERGKVAWPIGLKNMPLGGIPADQDLESIRHLLGHPLNIGSESTTTLRVERRQYHRMVIVPLDEHCDRH